MGFRIVLTGGPSTGKTTIIEQLDALGYICKHEISRQITRQGQKDGIDQLFLKDPLAFSKALFEGRKRQYAQTDNYEKAPVFFDRGLPDIVAYMDYLGESAPQSFFKDITHMRYDLVFIFPPWKAIHISDNERYESFEQGQKIYQHILSRYQNLDYDPIEVPTGSVNDRIEFILKFLRS